MTVQLQTRDELVTAWVNRVIATTDEVRYFGRNSVSGAYAHATAEVVDTGGQKLYGAVLRRGTLLGASGQDLVEVASEAGVPQRGPGRAVVLVIVQPVTAVVSAITTGRIEVAASAAAPFEVGDSVRLTLDDGSVSEVAVILAKTAGSGPNGGTELDVGLVQNLYDVGAGIVRVLLRRTIAVGTRFVSSSGVVFESLSALTVGDSNPAMAGESEALALADKVWCEAVNAGSSGNVEALTVGLQTPDSKVRAAFNPSRAFGGTDQEAEFDLKYRTAHVGQLAAVETPAMIEAVAQLGNERVLRAVSEPSTVLGELRVRVLTRSGGGLSSDASLSLASYIQGRMRSGGGVEVLNLIPTAVEVVASVTLTPIAGLTVAQRLARAWRRAADKLSVYLDYRKWGFGEAVDAADLLSIVNSTQGIATVTVSSFRPSALVAVGPTSIPVLVRLTLTETTTGQTFGASLSPTY